MKPYYEHAGIVIYHGDCREILPTLDASTIDLLLTDPPYGISWKRGSNAARLSKAHVGIQNDHDTSARDDVLAMFHDTPAIVFGSFYAPFPNRLRHVLVWEKAADAGVVGSTTGVRRDVEPVFLCGPWPLRNAWRGSVLRTPRGNRADCEAFQHPHHKPPSLIVQLLEIGPHGTILDPFLGSGSTLVAAKMMGLKAIGIEIEESHCETSARRLEQEVLPIYGDIPESPTQLSMIVEA